MFDLASWDPKLLFWVLTHSFPSPSSVWRAYQELILCSFHPSPLSLPSLPLSFPIWPQPFLSGRLSNFAGKAFFFEPCRHPRISFLAWEALGNLVCWDALCQIGRETRLLFPKPWFDWVLHSAFLILFYSSTHFWATVLAFQVVDCRVKTSARHTSWQGWLLNIHIALRCLKLSNFAYY